MTNEIAAQIAGTINNQLCVGGQMKVWSWGFNAPKFGINDKKQAYLRFRVQGFKLRGVVIINYNDGRDSYDINFYKGYSKVPYKSIEDVYGDNLTDIIDREVETTNDQSDTYKYLVDKENNELN